MTTMTWTILRRSGWRILAVMLVTLISAYVYGDRTITFEVGSY